LIMSLRVSGLFMNIANHIGQRFIELTEAWKDIDACQLQGIVSRLALAREYRNTVWIAGNGGSAANASHMSLHLRQSGILAHALVSEIPLVTAISNDLHYDQSFVDQISSHARPGDVAVLISGSGNSRNIIELAGLAKERRMDVLGLLGFGGGATLEMCDNAVTFQSQNYAVVEDLHSVLVHLISERLVNR